MIDIINVEQTFGDRRILKNVNLQINKEKRWLSWGLRLRKIYAP